jgi:hypothetical protein
MQPEVASCVHHLALALALALVDWHVIAMLELLGHLCCLRPPVIS